MEVTCQTEVMQPWIQQKPAVTDFCSIKILKSQNPLLKNRWCACIFVLWHEYCEDLCRSLLLLGERERELSAVLNVWEWMNSLLPPHKYSFTPAVGQTFSLFPAIFMQLIWLKMPQQSEDIINHDHFPWGLTRSALCPPFICWCLCTMGGRRQ